MYPSAQHSDTCPHCSSKFVGVTDFDFVLIFEAVKGEVCMDTIRVFMKLGDVPEEYEFTIDRRVSPPVLHIPGDHRGPDLCFPYKPEQENWLNGLVEYVIPFWYCQWRFLSDGVCDDFIEYLRESEEVL